MSPWIDPDETDPEMWTGEQPDRSDHRSVYERAHETTLPYQRREGLTLSDPDVADEFWTAAYDSVKLHYNIGVDVEGRVKLLSKGHLWGAEESHRRFRIQYRRPAEPTTVPPFEEYSAWIRYQSGTVRREDGEITFEAAPSETEEETHTFDWQEMYSADQLRLAEAELVRNPPLARYALRRQGLWADVRDALRYNPVAFDWEP